MRNSKSNAPSPERYRSAGVADREAADQLYKEDRAWEKVQEDKVHAWLASDEGQAALKR